MAEQPKKPAGGAFGQFMKEKRTDFQKQLPGKAVSEVSKLAGSTWKALPENMKAPYQKKYEEAKVKYEKDFAAFIAAGGVKTKGLMALRAEKRKNKDGPKSKKDPNKPKCPPGGAFGFYLTKNRTAFIKECQGQPITAATKLAGTKWRVLSAADKAPFEAEYQKAKEAYQEAMKRYVPPVVAESEGDEEGGDGEEDESEAEGTPAPKKADKAPPAKKTRTTDAGAVLSPEVLADAKKKGLDLKLKAMMQVQKIIEKNISAGAALKALENAGGKAIEAKKALLGA